MKKLMTAMAAVAALGLGSKALAVSVGDPVDVEVLATIDNTLQITVTSATTYDFGTVSAGFAGVAASAFDLQNTGGGQTETYSLQVVNTSPWALAAAPGIDTYALAAQFASAAPALGTFGATHDLTTGSVAAGVSPGGQFASASQDAVGTTLGETVNMWVRFDAPTSVTTGAGAIQHFRINVDASAP